MGKYKIKRKVLDDLKDHGLGVYLMKNIMNEIEYKPIKNGNILYMKKYFSEVTK